MKPSNNFLPGTIEPGITRIAQEEAKKIALARALERKAALDIKDRLNTDIDEGLKQAELLWRNRRSSLAETRRQLTEKDQNRMRSALK